MERQQLYCKKVINPKVLITSLIFFASFLMIGELNHAWAAEETVNSQKNINVNNTINLVEKNSLKSVDDKASYKETINNKISVFNNENKKGNLIGNKTKKRNIIVNYSDSKHNQKTTKNNKFKLSNDYLNRKDRNNTNIKITKSKDSKEKPQKQLLNKTFSNSGLVGFRSAENYNERTQNYVVKKGDYLGAIAKKFNTTVSKIQKLNNIKNPNFILIGQVLKVPFISSNNSSTNTNRRNNSSSTLNYLNSLAYKGWDFDGAYGNQCFDLVNVYCNHLYGHGLRGYGAKDIPFANNFRGEATVYRNTPTFKAELGDVAVFSGRYGGGFGHTAIVLNGNYDGKLMKFQSLDQNWYGGDSRRADIAHKVVHNYDYDMYFIRPYKKA